MLKQYRYYLYGALALLVLVMILLLVMRSRAKTIGAGVGTASGTVVGAAIGSARSITEGVNQGIEDGEAAGLSAQDVSADMQVTMESVGKLEVLVAGVTLKNMNQIGEAYHALYIISADAVFSVDLQQADISYSKDNSDIYISVPKPELELFLDQNSTEKLAETQNFSWTVSAQDGVIAYLNSMTNIIEKVKDSMANYDTLMETAENSARKQVESLASAVCGENQHIHVHFK